MDETEDDLPWTTPAITILFGFCASIQIAFLRTSYNLPQIVFEKAINETITCKDEAWFCTGQNDLPSFVVTLIWSGTIAVSFLGNIPAGIMTRWFCSRIGRKWMILVSCFPTILGLLLQGAAGFFNFWYLLIPGRFIHSLGATSLYLSVKYFTYEIYPVSTGPKHQNVSMLGKYLTQPLILSLGFSFLLGNRKLWMYMLIFPLAACGIILLNILSLPETPRFLIRQRAKKKKLIDSIHFYFGDDQNVGQHQGLIVGQEPVHGQGQRGFRGMREAWRKNSEQKKAMKFVLVSGIISTLASSTILTMFSTEIFHQHLGFDRLTSQILTVTVFNVSGIALVSAGKVKWVPSKMSSLFNVSLALSLLGHAILICLSFWVQYIGRIDPTQIDIQFKISGIGMILLMVCSHRFGMVQGFKSVANDRLSEHVSEPTISLSIGLGQCLEFICVLTFVPISRFLGPTWSWIPITILLLLGLIYLTFCCPKVEHKERLPLIRPTLEPERRSRIHHIHREPQRFRKKQNRIGSSGSPNPSRDGTPDRFPPTSPATRPASLHPPQMDRRRSKSDSDMKEMESGARGSQETKSRAIMIPKTGKKRRGRKRKKIANAFKSLVD